LSVAGRIAGPLVLTQHPCPERLQPPPSWNRRKRFATPKKRGISRGDFAPRGKCRRRTMTPPR